MKFNPFSILLRSKTSPFSEILKHDFISKYESVGEHFEGHILSLPKKRPINEPEQNEAFSALLRLNLFRYTTKLESINHPALTEQPRM